MPFSWVRPISFEMTHQFGKRGGVLEEREVAEQQLDDLFRPLFWETGNPYFVRNPPHGVLDRAALSDGCGRTAPTAAAAAAAAAGGVAAAAAAAGGVAAAAAAGGVAAAARRRMHLEGVGEAVLEKGGSWVDHLHPIFASSIEFNQCMRLALLVGVHTPFEKNRRPNNMMHRTREINHELTCDRTSESTFQPGKTSAAKPSFCSTT
jgi:hypothetical protein